MEDFEPMTLTKTQIAKATCNKTGIPKWRSAELVDSAFDVIEGTLESGEDVLISDSGNGRCGKKGSEREEFPRVERQ
jgi:nucleoid DNA-binding protein